MSKRTNPEIEAGVAAMYSAGDEIKKIASAHGVGVWVVSRIAKRLGILRTKSEGQAVRAARDMTGWSRIGKKGAVQSEKTGIWHPCDSAYEYARMLQLDRDPGVLHWKRCARRIPYVRSGVKSLYVPDIEVTMQDGSVRVEEIKPKKMLDRGSNPEKFEAAKRALSKDGVQFVVVTEDDIGWKEIRKLDGLGLNGVPDEERMQRARKRSLRHLHAMTPERRADYNEKARLREAAKRATNRDEYNRRAREYPAARLARNSAPFVSLF
jgi:hypothetical protein